MVVGDTGVRNDKVFALHCSGGASSQMPVQAYPGIATNAAATMFLIGSGE
jgi:hypothetical protein